MKLIVLPQAADEFEDAAAYYEDKQAGLGRRFRDEVDKHIRWIVGHAEMPRLRAGGYRRVNLRVFPHYIAYLGSDDIIWILAVAHAHRRPEYWIDRKGDAGQAGAAPNGGPRTGSAKEDVTEGPPSVS